MNFAFFFENSAFFAKHSFFSHNFQFFSRNFCIFSRNSRSIFFAKFSHYFFAKFSHFLLRENIFSRNRLKRIFAEKRKKIRIFRKRTKCENEAKSMQNKKFSRNDFSFFAGNPTYFLRTARTYD